QILVNGTSSLRFRDSVDHVYVPGDSVSLDASVSDELTVEAWFKFPDSNILDEYKYGPAFGYQPDLIQISEGVYGIAYRDQGQVGTLKTIRITDGGAIIGDIYNHSIEFADPCYWPKIIHVVNDTYLIALATSDTNPKYCSLQAVQVLENGTTGPLLGSYSFGFKEVYDHDLIHIADNISAIVFRNNQQRGEIRTFGISDDGLTISNFSSDGAYVFEDSKCYEPNIIQVYGDIYAIAYRGQNDEGIIKTVKIENDGKITKTVVSSFPFEQLNETFNPVLSRISQNILAITYRDDYSTNIHRGFIKTVEILDNGTITQQVNDTLMFDGTYCNLPKIANIVGDIFVIAYETDDGDSQSPDGYVAVVEIAENGSIYDSVISKTKFNRGTNTFGYEPDILRVTDEIYAIAFRCGSSYGTPHEGTLITNLLTDYSTPDPSAPFSRGLVLKEGAYGIFVNRTHIAIHIQNVLYKVLLDSIASIDSSNFYNWHHVAFTYNKTILVIYFDGLPIFSTNANVDLICSSVPIYFGKNFFGFIDEVAIFPWVLTDAEILEHKINPASLENI
ncbi:MAG: LamG domain-containing protein, partial [Thermoplasmatales archaeon]